MRSPGVARHPEYLVSLKLCLVDCSGIPESSQVSRELLPDALQFGINNLPEYCLHKKSTGC